MTEETLRALCSRVRPELECLGELARPLLDAVADIERTAGLRTLEMLSDPSFALEILTASCSADAASIGKMLDFLRHRANGAVPGVGSPAMRRSVTVAEAVAQYDAGALALMARGTQHTYRTWIKRLVAAHGEDVPASLTAGDLTDLIARHVLANRGVDERRRSGRSAEENAVGAYRHLWGYFVEKQYVETNIASRLRKPARVETRRRGFTPQESALLRELARSGGDPLLDEITLVLPERLGLRRIELCRMRLGDIDRMGRTVEVWGKGDKSRIVPIPPHLFGQLEMYVESRRPAHLSAEKWWRSDEILLRRPPAGQFPLGRPAGRRRIEDLFTRLQRYAPDLFAGRDVSLHSYRHALGTFTDGAYGRAMTRAVLGHTSRRTPTDHYVHIPISQIAEVLTEYENQLLGWLQPAPGVNGS